MVTQSGAFTRRPMREADVGWLAHVYDAEIAKARSRRRAKLVAVGSQNKPAGVNRRAMCGEVSQPTRRFSADVLPRLSISS